MSSSYERSFFVSSGFMDQHPLANEFFAIQRWMNLLANNLETCDELNPSLSIKGRCCVMNQDLRHSWSLFLNLLKKRQHFSTVRNSLVLIKKQMESLAKRLKMQVILPPPVFFGDNDGMAEATCVTGRAQDRPMSASGGSSWILRSPFLKTISNSEKILMKIARREMRPTKPPREGFREYRHIVLRCGGITGCHITTKSLRFHCRLPTVPEDVSAEESKSQIIKGDKTSCSSTQEVVNASGTFSGSLEEEHGSEGEEMATATHAEKKRKKRGFMSKIRSRFSRVWRGVQRLFCVRNQV